jgi:hypothetical protein
MSSARLGLFLLLLLITNTVWGEVIKTPDGKGNSQQVQKGCPSTGVSLYWIQWDFHELIKVHHTMCIEYKEDIKIISVRSSLVLDEI